MDNEHKTDKNEFLRSSFKEKLRVSALSRQSVKGLVQAAKATPGALMQPAQASYLKINDAISQHLVDELHTYPRKNHRVTFWLWMLLGIFGAHRFYLGKIGTGVGMTLTVGGVLGWWIYDAFKLTDMVDQYNADQEARERDGRPPVGMDFVPISNPEVLDTYPEWAMEQSEEGSVLQGRLKKRELIWDGVAMVFFGAMLGSFTSGTDYRTAAVAVLAMILTINFADQLLRYYHVPLIRQMIRWDYRLRLFYYFNAPGSRLKLYFRPFIGLFYAPFKEKARNEVTLFLEIGGVFILFRIIWGILSGETLDLILTLNIGGFLGGWVKGIVMGFFAMYAFAAPIGAILMKNVLLRRANFVQWGLSLLVLYFIASSLFFTSG